MRLIGPLHERVLLELRGCRSLTGRQDSIRARCPQRQGKFHVTRMVPKLSTAVDRPVDGTGAARAAEPGTTRVPAAVRAGGKLVDTRDAPRRDADRPLVEKWTTPGENAAGSDPLRANPHRSFSPGAYSAPRPGICGGTASQRPTPPPTAPRDLWTAPPGRPEPLYNKPVFEM